MVYSTRFKDYVDYFRKAHKIIYGEEAEDSYAYIWAKEVWRKQESGMEIDLPSLKELKSTKEIGQKIKMINRGVYGGR